MSDPFVQLTGTWHNCFSVRTSDAYILVGRDANGIYDMSSGARLRFTYGRLRGWSDGSTFDPDLGSLEALGEII